MTRMSLVTCLLVLAAGCDHVPRCNSHLVGQRYSDFESAATDSYGCLEYGELVGGDTDTCGGIVYGEALCIVARAPSARKTDRFSKECGVRGTDSEVICNVLVDPETDRIKCVWYFCPD